MAKTIPSKRKQKIMEDVSEIADILIEHLRDFKERVAKMNPEKKKKAVKALAGAGALLVGLGLVKRIKKKRAKRRAEKK